MQSENGFSEKSTDSKASKGHKGPWHCQDCEPWREPMKRTRAHPHKHNFKPCTGDGCELCKARVQISKSK